MIQETYYTNFIEGELVKHNESFIYSFTTEQNKKYCATSKVAFVGYLLYSNISNENVFHSEFTFDFQEKKPEGEYVIITI